MVSQGPDGVLDTRRGRRCADDDNRGAADGTKIQLYDCNGSVAQQFTVKSDGSLGIMGKCMDVTHSGTTNGTLVQLWTCNNSGAQQWKQQADGSLVNPESSRCLDDPNSTTANGTQLQIWDCNGSSAQKWKLPSRCPAAPRRPRDEAGQGSGW